MSHERFIRCKHCGMPHEADARVCEATGQSIEPVRRARVPTVPPLPAAARPAPRTSDPRVEATSSVEQYLDQLVDGRYRIESLIGRGGMGAVYRAVHTRIEKPVAIKVLLRGHEPGSAASRRLMREARIAGSLGHANVVEVYDLGQLPDGTPYLVMELLEGETLAHRIELLGALPLGEVLCIGEQVLEGLGAAHERGIVHRDLKPDNVFLVRRPGQAEPLVKILDFGVSKSVDENTLSLTMTGSVVGTPYYLAPEQARGERKVDRRVDIWAAGVLLYEALTGRVPFRADSYNALLVKILHSRPLPPSSLRPGLPTAIESVVMRALQFEPDDRYPSAAAMLDALRSARLGLADACFDEAGDATITSGWHEPGLAASGDATSADEATEVSDVVDRLGAVAPRRHDG
ncbi:MAG: serine/threonine-protein kinase [Myxococcales bacterium]|nr:serine/threonine-protein kinase [Myxococcales bacterium]